MNRSLKANTDENNKINDIRLSLNTPKGSKIIWILVEGEDDCKIYPKFFDKDKTKIEYISGGKIALTKALEVLLKETQQVLGIQDADFLHLNKLYPQVENLFYTDYHDIEMTMLSFEDVRNNLLTEYELRDKQQTIWQNVLEEASYIGYIRWYNDINNREIKFKGLKYGDMIGLNNGKIYLIKSQLLEKLNERSKNKKEDLTEKLITEFIEERTTNDSLNLCNGHDTINLFSLLLEGKASANSFAKELRLSFTNEHFRRTKLYENLQKWQTQNKFQIFIF
ncbi:DUF4435 domain-containing protein [Capnocytophaga leadbetteri]